MSPIRLTPTITTTISQKGTIIATALTGRTGPIAGRRIEIVGPMVIGREDADITIEDAEISRRHAEVRPSGDGIEIEDLGSTNGTFVNDQRIEGARVLSPGDVVRVGQTELGTDPERAGGTAISQQPGGTTVSKSPDPTPSDQDATLAEPRKAGTSGTSGGAPPAVESWSPAPTGTGPGPGAYIPPQGGGAYTPPPATSGYTPPQSPPASGGPPGAPYGSGGYGGGPAGQRTKGSKTPLIAGLVVLALLIVAALVFFTPLGEVVGLRQSDEDKIRETITEFGQKIGDPEVCDLVTQNFLDEATGLTGTESVDACRTDIAEQAQDPVDIEIKEIDINGERATVEAEAEGDSATFELEKQDDGQWLIDGAGE